MSRQINFDLDKIGLFRKAGPSDIVQGNIVFLIGDGNEMHRMTIDEVLQPNDRFKAFCADDGCRYGLDDLWVLKSSSDLQKRVQELESILTSMKESLNSL